MTKAKQGDTVKVHYTGKLDDGTVFDSSQDREPLEFKVGEGQVIKGFEDGITGMTVEEEKTLNIPPEEGYGNLRDDLIVKFPKENFPEDIKPEIGMKLQLQQPNGTPVIVTVKDILENEVILDANHQLAGKNLTFDLKLVEIN
ncbi:MAG: peptidylprolyl isomerase [Victivallales bacterium]|nr:peptidylprolyl isomerase [Victivallales bacterium]MCF7889178.1 peptidylprolyl isomerase [Victivallales bacterium]